MIQLESRGDAVWKKQFASAEDAFNFLWSLVGRNYAYHIYHHKTARVEKQDQGKLDMVRALLDEGFNIEDDLIIWREKGKSNKYCAGWHHSRVSGRPEIIMSDGTNLYSLFEEVGELRFDEGE